MNLQDVSNFESTLGELLAYANEVEKHYPELNEQDEAEEKEQDKETKQPKTQSFVPHQAAMKKDEQNSESAPEENNATENNTEEVPKAESAAPGQATPPAIQKDGRFDKYHPTYKAADTAIPVVPIKVIKEAIEAIQSLQQIQNDYCPVLVSYIDDEHEPSLHRAKTKEEAKRFILDEMEEVMNNIDSVDDSDETYIDDGTVGETMHEPTPINRINDDESLKGEAAAEGKLHVYVNDDTYIIFNELSGRTARWDILNLDEARRCDGSNKKKKHEEDDEPEEPKKKYSKFEQWITTIIKRK